MNATPGMGEIAERRRTRARLSLAGLLFVSGMLAGVILALAEPADAPILAGDTIPAALAIALAVFATLAMVWGSVRLKRLLDEFEILENLRVGSFGYTILLMSYPLWLLLWKGGLAPAPTADALYLMTIAATAIYALVRQYRLR